jgi:FKBP-type peptidyl-prolyl cis-trans isomerase FklB
MTAMNKHRLALLAVLGLGITLALRSAAAQGSAAGTVSQAPAVKSQNTSAAQSNTASPLKSQKDQVSYALGMSWGNQLREKSVEIDPDLVLQGLKDALAGGKTLMTEDEARAAIVRWQKDLRAKDEANIREEAEKNRLAGQAFRAANKARDGVVTLPSGLQYKILIAGAGPKPALTDKVTCNYRGTLIDGSEFDDSYKRGQPATFLVGTVIKGWRQALQLMPVGSKWQLVIPPNLAYGLDGKRGVIPPNATLIFEVELISIQGKQ